MKQFVVTTAMGKRLIGRAIARVPEIQETLQSRTVAIIAGTTNGYVAEEILKTIGQSDGFDRAGFRRGLVVPKNLKQPGSVREFPGDVIITGGKWQQGKTIFDVVDDLDHGDVILKGANAVNLPTAQAGVYIGHPQGGTIGSALPAVIGRRVHLIVPVGVEKRVDAEIHALAEIANAPDSEGPRLMPLPGTVFTELDAIGLLTGCEAAIIAGGGVYGAEGCVWIGVDGSKEEVDQAEELMSELADEPPCEV